MAGTATGNLLVRWVPVKGGMSSSRPFLILIRTKFTDLTDSQTEACHQARNRSENLRALFAKSLAFPFPQISSLIGAFSWS